MFCLLNEAFLSLQGEYIVEWKYIGPCETGTGSNEIQMNVKMTKKNKRLQMVGNYTMLIPWDENISVKYFINLCHLHSLKTK